MLSSHGRRMGAAIVLTLAALAVALHACSEQPTEITDPQTSGVNAVGKSTLTLRGDTSTATGTLVSNRGGMTCTVTFSAGRVTLSGLCSKSFKTGTVLLIKASPPANGGTVAWTGCDPAVTDDPLTCKVTLNSNKSINAKFGPPPGAYLLTVQGGAGGSGSVQSAPSGISCTVTNGSTGSGCSAAFAASASVKLSASAGSGSYIKAWSGGGCENAGTGKGTNAGTCTVLMTQAHTVVVSFEADADEFVVGKWAAPIDWHLVAIHTHLLPNGQVMSSGRMTSTPVTWNPVTGQFTNLPLPADFFCSGHAFLPDGRLIVAGGHSGLDNYGIKVTYLFDFALNQWTRAADMRNGRWYPTLTTLANGEVLTISGGDTSAVLNDLPEVYQTNQGTPTWRALTEARKAVPYYPMMFVGPDGRVAMVGPGRQTWYLNATSTGGWTAGPSTIFTGNRDYGSAVMYDAGKILLVGGNTTPTATAEVINLGSAASWRNVQAMSVARRQHNATLLADGTVLVTGGSNAQGFNAPPTDGRVLTAERWNPETETWSQLGRMSHQRLYHSTALLLLDGRVLSVGSGEPPASGQPNDLTAEIFSPPYLFNRDGTSAARPTITDAPINVSYGQAFTVATPNPASIVKVTFIRLSSVTHSFNQNQRMNRLSFSATASGLTVVAPPSGNHAPPGHYMLFIVNSNGVPSQGKVIRIF